jgi:Tat protein secretion system quality control protein TatD with DNase activity
VALSLHTICIHWFTKPVSSAKGVSDYGGLVSCPVIDLFSCRLGIFPQ